MEKIMIYPYSKDYEPYIKNAEILGGDIISALVSPRGWGYEGDVIVDSQDKEYVVSAEFSERLINCSCVWFVADGRLEMPRELLKEKLLEAVNHKKRIFYTRYADDNYEEMKKLIPLELYIDKKIKHKDLLKLSQDRIYDINTPIIVVAGTGMDTDKLAVQFILKQKFRERGYKVTLICSRQDGEWEGVYGVPEFVFDHSVSKSEKIIKLNHYVKQIEKSEGPDLFIVGIPGAVLPFDNIDHNEFGILAYEMSFAVPCDAAVLCMMYSPLFDGDYSQLAVDLENRFGFNVVGVHIAAVVTDVQQFYEESKMSHVSISRNVIDKKVSDINDDKVWNILSRKDAEKAVSQLIDMLSNW